MSLQNLNLTEWTIEEVNEHLKLNYDRKYWEFLIKKINYKEISFDNKLNTIIFPPYIPMQEVVQEILHEIKEGFIGVSKCSVCDNYFDINKENGIFGDSQNLKRFICNTCSETLSAKEFYENHLKI